MGSFLGRPLVHGLQAPRLRFDQWENRLAYPTTLHPLLLEHNGQWNPLSRLWIISTDGSRLTTRPEVDRTQDGLHETPCPRAHTFPVGERVLHFVTEAVSGSLLFQS